MRALRRHEPATASLSGLDEDEDEEKEEEEERENP